MSKFQFETALTLDVYRDTSGVELGATIWRIEPSSIPHHIRRQFAQAYRSQLFSEVSLLYVDHDAEYRAVARVTQLYPAVLLEITDVHMPEGEPRETMECSQQF